MAIRPEQTACVLLGAGRSRRFGDEDKLAMRFRGRTMLEHSLALLDGFAFARKILVCRDLALAPSNHGFEFVVTDDGEAPMSYSIRLGIAALGQAPVKAVLIALADMPNVPALHIDSLLLGFRSDDPYCMIASRHGDIRMPPAVFGRGLFPKLAQLERDRGARQLLDQAETVAASAEDLLDIDTPADLTNYERR